MRPIMKRTNLNLTEQEHRLLQQEALSLGISISELLRRIVDEFFKEGNHLNSKEFN